MALTRVVNGKRVQTWPNASLGDTVHVTNNISPMMAASGGIMVDTSNPDYLLKWGIFNLVDNKPAYNEMLEDISVSSSGVQGNDWVVEYTVSPAPMESATKRYSSAVEEYANERAAERGYDSVRNAMTYAGYANPYQAEGEAYGKWLADCWVVCYQVLADVQAATRTAPTKEELIAELPALVLP